MTPTKTNNNWFTHTSDKPYDRHQYKLHTKNNQSMLFDDYEQLRLTWFQTQQTHMLSHVEVLDIKQKKNSEKGFM